MGLLSHSSWCNFIAVVHILLMMLIIQSLCITQHGTCAIPSATRWRLWYNQHQLGHIQSTTAAAVVVARPLLMTRLRASGRIIDGADEDLNKMGSVTLLGSGPGDPELLTLQGYKLLKNASLVVADRLVSKDILALIECELKVANKKPGCAEEAQAELNQWVIDGAKAGRNVVRLKIGDPLLFGRGAEEVIEYRKHNITEITICPGLSSAYTAPLSANIPITHRGVANEVVICTGYGRNGSVVEAPEYRRERTVVLLMAVGRIAQIAEAMVKQCGYPGSTPVAIVERASTPQQRVLFGSLADIGAVAQKHAARAPATIVVGEVVHVLSSDTITAAAVADLDVFNT